MNEINRNNMQVIQSNVVDGIEVWLEQFSRIFLLLNQYRISKILLERD